MKSVMWVTPQEQPLLKDHQGLSCKMGSHLYSVSVQMLYLFIFNQMKLQFWVEILITSIKGHTAATFIQAE